MSAFESRLVTLHVYDLSPGNRWLGMVGMGVYHSGVEIAGKEYAFGDTGVFHHAPKGAGRHVSTAAAQSNGGNAPQIALKCSLPMGTYDGSFNHVHAIIRQLRETDFQPGSYNLSTRNCNHFAAALLRELTGAELPAWVNRAAGVASWFVGPTATKGEEALGAAPAADAGPPAAAAAAGDRNTRRQMTDQQRALLAKMGGKPK